MILLNGDRENACCGHCGLLRHLQLGDEVAQAIYTDFLTGTTISAHLAWFVVDTTFHLRCCYPQVLVFETKDFTENFIKGFGGKVCSFSEIMKSFPQQLKLSWKK